MASTRRKRCHQNATNGHALIEAYEEWDDYEGSYDRYECGNCGEYLTDSLQVSLYGKEIPMLCPRCGKELRW